MKPGRELDALVAEKVMGFTKSPEACSCGLRKGDFIDENGEKLLYEPRPYSTDIAAAWEVVRKMWGNGFVTTIVFGKFSTCQLNNFGTDGNINVVRSEVQPEHAICLAALKAVGVEVEKFA